jgi:UDP-N-acetylglucosamine 2-epimerase (non-hydrolysing)
VIHFVVGTRAQLFKLAPIMLECDRRRLDWRWIYTAQHRETIQQTLEMFGLPAPDYVVVGWETEASSMGRMSRWFAAMLLSLPKSRRILAGNSGRRHVLVTHGDTFTTWLGALMARVTRTKVMHVESGLRSFNLRQPFPEELNRLITFRLADYYACPGPDAVQNLARYKGIKIDTGTNTQADTLRFGLEHSDEVAIDVPDDPYVVATIHRYENIFRRARFEQIITELEAVSRRFLVLFIRHPATELQLEKLALLERLEQNDRVRLLPRLEYLPFVKLIRRAEFVITDGGGNQQELSYLGKPTLIFRDEVEGAEGVGKNAVVSKLADAVITQFLDNYKAYEQPLRLPDHSPSEMIVDFLEKRGFGTS